MIRRLALALAAAAVLTLSTSAVAPVPATAVGKCDLLPDALGLEDGCKAVDKKLGPVGDALTNSGLETLKEAATMAGFNPANMIEEWAKTIGESSMSLLQQMQKIMLTASTPDLANTWFNGQYLVMLGLGIILAAFALVRATVAMARGGPDAVLLARSVFNATVLYLPIVACLPLAIDTLVQIVYGLAKFFGTKASTTGGDAITAYLTTLGDPKFDAGTSLVGGVMSLLVIAGATFLGALIGLFELMISTLGVYLLTLLLPPLIALGVYPPWRTKAWGVGGALVGVAFVPPVLFLAYWTVWGAFAEFAAQDLGAMESLATLAFVCVATLAAVLSPLVVGYLIAHVVPDGSSSGHTRMVGGAGIAAAGAARTGMRMTRMASARAVGRGSTMAGGGASRMSGAARMNGGSGSQGRHAGPPSNGGATTTKSRPRSGPSTITKPKDGQ